MSHEQMGSVKLTPDNELDERHNFQCLSCAIIFDIQCAQPKSPEILDSARCPMCRARKLKHRHTIECCPCGYEECPNDHVMLKNHEGFHHWYTIEDVDISVIRALKTGRI